MTTATRRGEAAAVSGKRMTTVYQELVRRHHDDVSILYATLHPAVDPAAPDYLAAIDSLYRVVSRSPFLLAGLCAKHGPSSPLGTT